jgi:VCBS repeat-containing protein
VYTPAANYTGSDSFTYTASDGVLSDTATVTLTIGAANDVPVATDDAATTPEDTGVTIAVLSNDTDADGDPLSVSGVTQGAHGAVTLNVDQTVTYTPALNFFGTDSFSYTASDGQGGTDTATVTVTVTPVNDAPIANDDTYVATEDTPLNIISTLGVLANDTDVDGDTLTATVGTAPTHGTLSLDANGSFLYTPAANYTGSDSFTYTASDGVLSDTATVTLTIGAANDAPIANDDTATTPEDTVVTIAVLTNDTDADGNTLSIASVTQGSHGTVGINPDGTLTYTPALNFFGTDSFSYTASDGQGGTDTATVSMTVFPVNDAPNANDDAATTPEDTAISIAVLGNDTDVDGNSLSVGAVTQGSYGSVTINADQTITYTANADWFGTDTFTYTASDGQGGTDTATVNITVTPVNDVPVADAGPDVIVNEGQAVSRTGVYSDVDAGDTHTFQWVVMDVDGNIRSVSATLGLTFTPTDDDGQPYTATFTVTDSAGASATDDFMIQVLNVAPTVDAGPDQSVAEGSSVVFNGSFTDPSPVDTFTFLWDFGDGTTADTLTATHTYAGSGTYKATLTVTDDDGGVGTDTLVVTVSGGAGTGSIGDFVWHDLYHGPCHLVDGIQDAGEPGISGVLVNLLDAGQAVVASTLTDASGLYQFTGLAAGTYFVEIAPDNFQSGGSLEDWWATLPDRGTDEAKDSDGDLSTHRSDPVLLAAGGFDFDIDFGFFMTGIDLTKTGPATVEAGESILYHFRVENTGDIVLHGGAQVYDALINPCGDHQIWSGILQPGQVIEFDRAYTATMNDGLRGEVINTATAVGHPLRPDGFYLPNVIDVDRWTVEVTQELRAAIDIEKYVQVVESENGTEGLTPGYWKQNQHFDDWIGLNPGDRYEKVFGVDAPGCPTLLDALQANGGGANALLRHSTAALLNAAHPNIEYAYAKAEIISMVRGAFASGNYESVKNEFEAENEKGADLRDSGSGGSGGWLPGDGLGVDADEAPGLKVAVGETVQFTYLVTNPGEVALKNVAVEDDHGTPGVLSDDFKPNAVLKCGLNIGDKDRDGLLDPGETWFYISTTTVTAGQHGNLAAASARPVGGGITVTDTDPAHWFGVVPCTASIGNFVWKDLDKDGIQDAGEAGLKGVIVNLLDASGRKVVSTTTNDQGFYQFTDLTAGIYSVEISCKNFLCGGVLVGWVATSENRGSSEARDSDGDRVTHRSNPVRLSAGESNSDIDFGFYRYGGCGTGKGNNGVGNGLDLQPPGNPPINDGQGASPGHPGNKRFGHHRFGGISKGVPQGGGSGDSCAIDWSGKAAKGEQQHEAGVQPCSLWVMPFVCDMETDHPNKSIKISLSPARDEGSKGGWRKR